MAFEGSPLKLLSLRLAWNCGVGSNVLKSSVDVQKGCQRNNDHLVILGLSIGVEGVARKI
jgi:hypothetical protein